MQLLPELGKKKTLSTINLETLPITINELAIKQPILVLLNDTGQAKQLFSAWQFFAPHKKIIYFPDWELLPYERFSPSCNLVSERLLALWKIVNQVVDVVIMTVATAMQKLAPVSFVMQHTTWLETKQYLNLAVFRENLVNSGYQHVSQVTCLREFSIRGSIIDLFPIGSEAPYRIDLFDTEIDSIRTFDPVSQRTLEKVIAIQLLPAYEFPTSKKGLQIFQSQFKKILDDNPHDISAYQSISNGIFVGGLEFYLPLFFVEKMATILDYLPQNTVVIQQQELFVLATSFEKDVTSRFMLAGGDVTHPPLEPHYLYLNASELLGLIRPLARFMLKPEDTTQCQLPNLSIDRHLNDPVHALKNFIQNFSGRILLLADSLGRSETICTLARQNNLVICKVDSWHNFLRSSDSLAILVMPDFQHGFIMSEFNLALVTESDLYQNNIRRGAKTYKHRLIVDGVLLDLAEINIGDLVVHENHGIALYKGLIKLGTDEQEQEFMLLEYKGNAQLYVPVSQLNLISRYRGGQLESVQLHALGQDRWSKHKQKSLQKAWDTAAELLNIYAQREIKVGTRYVLDKESYQNFVDGFVYQETEDQITAIEQTLQDLASDRPMDRVICGDVGFGKTEVALRAAFVVAMSGKQVAILVPTTLLVEQHLETFTSRFASLPIRVKSISRFLSNETTKGTLKDLANGTIDIIIGTHKLMQPNIQFKNLGLLVIDEEHRFGVRQKEVFKQYRSEIDVLALTATPIPRTLSMALENLRDFSLIATAPDKRLAVQTIVQPFSEAVIREAILREITRHGQVFFVHNEVSSVKNIKTKLIELVPEAKICIAHGQIHERELEQMMRSFLRHQYDVMICTTIIETGIDIPNANTIIINRADRFGLAQLHQLRGRVGRSFHQAYAYLLTPESVTQVANKRLEAIKSASDLGSGFFLAMQDLEIRGSGEILGDNQSGEMMKVGLNLYTEMLRRSVKYLRQGKTFGLSEPLGSTCAIKLYSPALLPDDYCPDIHERLILYKKLAQAETKEQLDNLLEELIDRFGLLPPFARLLLESHYLRIEAEQLGVKYIDANTKQISILFDKHTLVDPHAMIRLIQTDPQKFQLHNGTKLTAKIEHEDPEKCLQEIKYLLAKLKSLCDTP